MTTSITFRVPSMLLADVQKKFPAKTRTESLLIALENGVQSQKLLEQKMIADYSGISGEEYEFVENAAAITSEIFEDQDENDYLQLLS